MSEWGAGTSGLMLLLMILSRRERRSEYKLTANLLTLSSMRGKRGPSGGAGPPPAPGEEHRDWLEEGVDEEVGDGWGVFGLCKTIFKVHMSTPSRSATLVRAIESQ